MQRGEAAKATLPVAVEHGFAPQLHSQLPFAGTAIGPGALNTCPAWGPGGSGGVGLDRAVVALPPQGMTWPGRLLSEPPSLLIAGASSNPTCVLRTTYGHTHGHTHTHAHACTTGRAPAPGRVNIFTRGSDRPVSQEKKCGQTRPRQPVGPTLATTPESRWPLKFSGKTLPAAPVGLAPT